MRIPAVGLTASFFGVLLAAATVAMLTEGGPRLAGPAGLAPVAFITDVGPGDTLCQPGETLYEDTDSFELTIGTYGKPGPALALRVVNNRRVITRGHLRSGWAEGPVRIPVNARPAMTVTGARLCLTNRGRTPVAFAGEVTDPSVGVTVDGDPRGGRLSLRSWLPGQPSLLSLTGKVADRYSRGNAGWLGPWTLGVILLLVMASLVAAGWALLVGSREPEDRPEGPRRRGRLGAIPYAGRLAALAALLGGLAWALLTPPFHVPDEIAHVSYVQGIVETATLPEWRANEEPYSLQQQQLLGRLRFYDVIGNPFDKPPWTVEQEAAVRDIEGEDLSRESTNALVASANPPLYYLLEAPAYGATRFGSLLDQVLPMRVISAVLGALTVLAIFMFLRELMPRRPWTWTAGALAAGYQPVFLFITSGVNPDALLFLCSALAFFAMARLMRRGLTVRRAAALAAVVAAGALTKPLFLALVPAAVTALAVSAIRCGPLRENVRRIAKPVGVSVLVAGVPVLLYNVTAAALFDRSLQGHAIDATTAAIEGHSLREQLSFIWQLFLPRAPWMNDQLPGFPLNDVWLHGFVGQFGWLDYSFSPWVKDTARWVFALVLLVALAAVLGRRTSVRSRWPEAACYLLAVAGLMAAIGVQHFNATVSGGPGFTQARYLLPLLALYGAAIAIAVRAFGGRVGPVVGVAVVALAALHTIAAMLLTVSRYYA